MAKKPKAEDPSVSAYQDTNSEEEFISEVRKLFPELSKKFPERAKLAELLDITLKNMQRRPERKGIDPYESFLKDRHSSG